MLGAVFGGGATFTMKLAVVTSKVVGSGLFFAPSSVVFAVSVSVMVAEPAIPGVTVRVFTSPHDVNVTEDGETAATPLLLELMEKVTIDDPVRLQPFLPSPFVGTTPSWVVRLEPPALRDMISAAASTVISSPLEISSKSGPRGDGAIGLPSGTGASGLIALSLQAQPNASAASGTSRVFFFM